MVPNQWYAVLELGEVPRGRLVAVKRLGENVVFWRDTAGRVACQRDKCAHRGAALSKGKLVDGCVQCPFHGFRYDVTGRCQRIPANGQRTPVPQQFHVHTYPTREEHGFVWVWWGEPRENLPPLPFFDDLGDGFTYATFRDHWPVHYSRAIENQLDVVHLPFVHYNTIGRGGRTLVDGPVVKWVDGERTKMNIFVQSRVDDGTPPLRPEQIAEPEKLFRLGFHFPNVWENYISEQVRVVAAFVPVDEENTLIYLRFYQNFMRAPLLRQLVTWLAMPFNVIVLRQDKRVVITQQPRKTALRMGEHLVQGDRPIVEYRWRREELIEAAAQ